MIPLRAYVGAPCVHSTHRSRPSDWRTKSVNMGLDVPAYILGALTASGGIIGYARTGSVPSIVAGCTVGILYGLGGYQIQSQGPYGIELGFLASLILGGPSIPRAIRLQKPVPIALSILAAFGLLTFGNAVRAKYLN